MHAHRALAPIAAAVLLAAACGSPQGPLANAAGPTVVASTNVYGSIAQAVGGNLVTVTSLITDPAADPHSYESTPADALKVSEAGIVVLNGGGYDEFMPRLIDASTDKPARPRTVIDVSQLSGLDPAPEPASAEPGAGEGEHGAFNEHVWYSLPAVQKLATRLATEFAADDAANAARYTDNAEAFTAQVTALADRATAIGTAAPGARVAATEPVPGYLLEQAGLVNATPEAFAEAVEEDTDPPAAVVQETLALFTGATPVRALILNSQTQTPTTDQIRQAAEAAGVPVVEMTETLPAGSTDYVIWMGGQIDALATALRPDRAS